MGLHYGEDTRSENTETSSSREKRILQNSCISKLYSSGLLVQENLNDVGTARKHLLGKSQSSSTTVRPASGCTDLPKKEVLYRRPRRRRKSLITQRVKEGK